jgi:hypothetical protein
MAKRAAPSQREPACCWQLKIELLARARQDQSLIVNPDRAHAQGH